MVKALLRHLVSELNECYSNPGNQLKLIYVINKFYSSINICKTLQNYDFSNILFCSNN